MGAENPYESVAKIFVAVDCIVFGFDDNDLQILLCKRKIEPMANHWSLMGGFLFPDESLDKAAERVNFNFTGLKNVYLEQLFTFGQVDRDVIDRVISVAYYALIKINDYDRDVVSKMGAQWFKISEIPALIFDHNDMINNALDKLRRKCRTQPIGFELLPEKFTIPQLQSLYEAIMMEKFDKRNFRKKILSMNLLDKLEEKDRLNSKKGAFLYKFNKTKYEKLSRNGFNFEL